MRRLVDADRLRRLMSVLGHAVREESRIYLTGGASAVLLDWRSSTIDVDIKIEPERDDVLRELPALKEALEINIELASPGDFIPELPGWRDRSPFIAREGTLSFHHYDFYAQALSKLERRHARDIDDVREMHARRLIAADRLLALFSEIEDQLYRYPAINPRSFRPAVERAVETMRGRD